LTTKSLLFNCEPLWQENRQGLRHKIPENVQSWIYESDSLTQRLRNYYGAGVAVNVLLQCWKTPFLSERRLLKLPEHQYSLIREVLLHVNGKPLILARTIIPATTVKTAKSNLSKLGSRPLGEIIFSYPKLERVAMDITLMTSSIWTPSALVAASIKQPIWGRRTVYAIAHQQMLVSEFFLPEVLSDF
jgi:chorismate--pyruvate lyase